MKELEDYPQFPNLLRNFQTDFIGFVVARFDIYKPFIAYINSLNLPPTPMTDLCSGSGEPAVSIFEMSNCFTKLELTDKYPRDFQADDERVVYVQQSVDVLETTFAAGRCYTMFNALHHFTDSEKVQLTEHIIKSRSRAYFVEILEPGFLFVCKILFMTTIGNLLLTPFVKPFSWVRLLLSYILPVNIFTIAYDGLVSVFKSRSLEQYQQLFGSHKDLVRVFHLKKGLSRLVVIEIKPVS